ncbi:MAG TPA: N-acetylmuramoyl-L-alanine amidase [Thermoanaerobaculia bacterium]|nr:N-acetylmuramoyl-L-alanine amidase [Thermoanaerobaculia bacterium]
MKICIDPGHGGADPGAIGTTPDRNLDEKTFTLSVSLFLRDELRDAGHTVIMTRQQDVFVGLADRAALANQSDADLFISIHANAAATPEPEGMEVFCFPGSVRGRDAATRVLESMVAEFPGHRNRGVKEANFAVLRLSGMPAILVECEFLTNPAQLEFLADEGNQRRLAAAIARAVPAPV